MQPKFKKNYYRNLLTWKELVALINIRPLMTDDRVKIDQVKHHEWTNGVWTLDLNCYPPLLLKEIIQNNICHLRDMSRCSRKVNDLAKRLEEEYNGSVDAHIYICRNPSLRHPFGLHFDSRDNVIVQCEGRTNFKVWDVDKTASREKGMNVHLTKRKDPPIMDVDMRPGDAIWIPKYYPHLATSKNARMSISFPVEENAPRQPREWIEL